MRKLTVNGYRITKNGSVRKSIERSSITRTIKEGNIIKENGIYYYFDRRQGNNFIYLP